MSRIFHIATRADWQEATRSGVYTTSTLGRSLEQEGYIHASRRDQVRGVFDRVYRGAREPLVLLTIATERLDAEVREEPFSGETYPHILGPLNRSAVVAVTPLDRHGGSQSMARLFALEMARRMGLAIAVMLTAVVGSVIADAVWASPSAPLVGALAGLLVGVLGVALAVRARP